MNYHDENWTTTEMRTATAGEAIGFPRACVKLSAEKTIVKTTAAADAACGLAFDSYASGDKNAEYLQRGRLRAVSGGAINIGDPLAPDDGTAGRVRTATTAEKVIGRAVTATTGAAEYFIGEFDFCANVVL